MHASSVARTLRVPEIGGLADRGGGDAVITASQ
jgi:hypothetical protein